MRLVMLTTLDNPYDPFERYDDWLNYDLLSGYNSSGYVDRIAKTSDALSDSENDVEIERAIDEIVANDPTNMFVKVVKEV